MKRFILPFLLLVSTISCKKDKLKEYFYVTAQTTNHITIVTINSTIGISSITWGSDVSVGASTATPDSKTITRSVTTDPGSTSFTMNIMGGNQKTKIVEVQKSGAERSVYYEF